MNLINYGEYVGWVWDEWMNMQDGSWRILAVAGDVRSRGSQARSFRIPLVLDEIRGRGKYSSAPAPNCGD